MTTRVLVTGASGYVGSRLTPHLRAAGCSVIAFGRSRSGDADISRTGSFTSPIDLALLAAGHPCLSANPYGFSKYLVEELARYFVRTDDALELDLYRIGVVVDEPHHQVDLSSVRLPFCQLGTVPVSTVVERLAGAILAPRGPGARVENLVSPEIPSQYPTIETLTAVLGARVSSLDLSAYRRPGNHRAGLWAVPEGR